LLAELSRGTAAGCIGYDGIGLGNSDSNGFLSRAIPSSTHGGLDNWLDGSAIQEPKSPPGLSDQESLACDLE
jgi:hypothetical protein